MTYAINCRDLNRECDDYFKADTFEEVQKIVTGHFQHDHGVREMTPELRNKVNSAIRES